MDVLDIMKHFNNIEKELSYIKGILLDNDRYPNKKNVSKPLNNSKKVVLLLDNGEKKYFNSISSAAKKLGIPRTTLRDNLNKKGFYYSYKGKVTFNSNNRVLLP